MTTFGNELNGEVGMERYYLLEGIFVLLGLTAISVVIKYPRETFVTIPLGFAKPFLARIWYLISIPLIIVLIPLIYLGEKYKWKINQTISKLMGLGTEARKNKRKNSSPT